MISGFLIDDLYHPAIFTKDMSTTIYIPKFV